LEKIVPKKKLMLFAKWKKAILRVNLMGSMRT
jgi:hypothetical protein